MILGGIIGFLLLVIIVLVVPVWVGHGTKGFWKNIWWDSVKKCWNKIWN